MDEQERIEQERIDEETRQLRARINEPGAGSGFKVLGAGVFAFLIPWLIVGAVIAAGWVVVHMLT